MKNLIYLLIIPIAVYLARLYGDQFDPETMRDQRVLITGASSGIGEQLAYQYAKLGARLVITARRAEQLRSVTKTCENLGARQVSFLTADMNNPEDRHKVIEHVEKDLGGLDILVLNHAWLLHGWWLGSADNIALLEEAYRVNFLSYVDLASKALPMLTTSRGRIGVVSAGLGEVGSVYASIYSSTKFALNGFFSSLRQELRHMKTGVSVTLVILGPVSTDIMVNITNNFASHIPKGFMATPTASAREILESVAQRRYYTYFDSTIMYLSFFNAMLPEYFEDFFADITLNDARSWLSYLSLFLMRTFQ